MSAPYAVLSWSVDGGAVRQCTVHDVCTVGRDPTSRIVVRSSNASRLHARVDIGPDGPRLTNTSRTLPLVVNGSKTLAAGEHALLVAGDRFRVGSQLVHVVEVAGAASPLLCANPTCQRPAPTTAVDCPWCGVSLAFAATHQG